jgi:hypothetical protein
MGKREVGLSLIVAGDWVNRPYLSRTITAPPYSRRCFSTRWRNWRSIVLKAS